MRIPANTSDGRLGFQIGVPNTPQPYETAPRLLVEPGFLQVSSPRGRTFTTSPAAYAHCLTDMGLYSNFPDDPDSQFPRRFYPFAEDGIIEFLRGDLADKWAAFSFAIEAYRLRIDYYDVSNPERLGMIEFGRNFSVLTCTIWIPESDAIIPISGVKSPSPKMSRYVIQLWRNPHQFHRPFLRKYLCTDCIATVARHEFKSPGESRLTYRREISGRDYVNSLA